MSCFDRKKNRKGLLGKFVVVEEVRDAQVAPGVAGIVR
jgi:hypothetical protein